MLMEIDLEIQKVKRSVKLKVKYSVKRSVKLKHLEIVKVKLTVILMG